VPDFNELNADGFSMTRSKILMALALIAFLGVTACGGDTEPEQAPPVTGEQQAPGAGQEMDMDPETMALVMEAQELQQQLAPIQQAAMEDEALATRLEELQEQIEAAMREESPELFAQMEQLEADFMAAQEAGDQERVQAVGMEAQSVQMQLQSVQQAVLERPDVREPVDAFEEARRARMIEIDPQAGEIMDRIDEIFEEMGTP
jgi:hypothetical protein